jgi:hypothetical protein
VIEKHSTVPYSYRARLLHSFRVGPERGEMTREAITMTGHVHPEPYDHATAVACAQDRLKLLVDAGWDVVDLRVLAYGEGS